MEDVDTVLRQLDDETNSIWTNPRRIIAEAQTYCANATIKLDLVIACSTIEMATICGIMELENREPLVVGELECTIKNTSFEDVPMQDAEGNIIKRYDFSDEKTFEVENDGTFTVAGYYGPSDRGPSMVVIEVVRTTSEYVDPDPDDKYLGETESDIFLTTEELLVDRIDPDCIIPFEIK